MKTPKANRDEVRENSVTIPMTAEEKERIRAYAEKKGLSMSAFVRMIVNEIFERGNS